jgi:effector-binding domain-containing protein
MGERVSPVSPASVAKHAFGDAPLEPADGVILRKLPATRAAEHVYRGPYEELPALYGALEAAIRERGPGPEDLAREHYLVNPSTAADPADFVTRIVWPVSS